MFNWEYSGLKRLGLELTPWGKDYRLKIKNKFGRWVFISKPSNPKYTALIAKTYKNQKITEARLKTHLSPDYKAPEYYKKFVGVFHETHEFTNYTKDKLIDTMRDIMMGKKRAFKVSIQLGYILIDRTTGHERDYHPSTNTALFDDPIAVNSKSDVDNKVINPLDLQELAEKIKYPRSRYVLKEINSARLLIYYRNHKMGENLKIPDFIKNSPYVIDFPNTKNKCAFYCIGYHFDETKDRKRINTPAKNCFKQWYEFKNLEYSPEVYKNYQGVDIMQFDELEVCFNVGINAYQLDKDTLEVEKIIDAKFEHDQINILDYEGHAMYIKNVDHLLNKYPCSKCGAVFDSCSKLRDHRKNKCEFKVFDSFVKEPTAYEPRGNNLKRLLNKYEFYDKSFYLDHFIVFDFEAVLEKVSEPRGENTVYTNRHKAISVSVCDSLSKKAKCFVSEDVKELIKMMLEYMREVASNIRSHYGETFDEVDELISSKMKEAREKCKDKSNDAGKPFAIDRSMLDKALSCIPVIGFNSGRYDLNLIKKDLFAELLKFGEIKSAIKNPSYMAIKSDDFKFLDIRNYLPPDVSYDKYLETYLGGCKCKDKIRCTCGLAKGLFCYEYITSFDKLNETVLPPRKAFDSKLKSTKCTVDEYERLKFVWNHYNMKSIKDLLVWYNNLDVVPFIDAINKQRQFYKRYQLDMFADAVSLPSLAEKIMYQTSYMNIGDALLKKNITSGIGKPIYEYVKELEQQVDLKWWNVVYKARAVNDRVNNSLLFTINMNGKNMISLVLSFNCLKAANFVLKKIRSNYQMVCPNLVKIKFIKARHEELFHFSKDRIKGYKKQDAQAGREFGLTTDHLNQKLIECDYLCTYCECMLTIENVSADRINNNKGHIDGNIVISCVNCNVARKDMNINSFKRKKLIERNSSKIVYSIDQENEDIFRKMKANIAGGPSIIFKRYSERNKTYIRNGDKPCKKNIGYDANALYLWCLGNVMPCGRLTTIEAYDGVIDDIKSDKQFGFLECDIETPEHLKDYFSEMTPIFKNVEIDCNDSNIIGNHMFEYNQEKGSAKPSKKLIGSYFGKKILIYTPLLKWYLSHGMVITKTYSFIKATAHRPFKQFMEDVSQARRGGDVDRSQAMIAEMMKLVGNSAFGRSGMDKSKHKSVKYESDGINVRAIIEKQNFHDLEELDGSVEITLKKRKIFNNNPIHLSIAIYQLAKLRMLQFYYDCIDFYFDRSDFEYIEMDTDSAYIAFSDEEPFKNLIKPYLVEHFNQHKYKWFPRDYDDEVAKFDRRTAGLFKEEWRGDGMFALSSKNYICFLPDEKCNKDKFTIDGKDHYLKISAKGVQKRNNIKLLLPENFEKVVKSQAKIEATNSGFRLDNGSKTMITYTQNKIGLNYYYDKRQVQADGITTKPLPI